MKLILSTSVGSGVGAKRVTAAAAMKNEIPCTKESESNAESGIFDVIEYFCNETSFVIIFASNPDRPGTPISPN